MDKYIVIEIYTSDNSLLVVKSPIRNSVHKSISSLTNFIHESFNDKELEIITIIGEYESVTVRKKDIIKILINGRGAI